MVLHGSPGETCHLHTATCPIPSGQQAGQGGACSRILTQHPCSSKGREAAQSSCPPPGSRAVLGEGSSAAARLNGQGAGTARASQSSNPSSQKRLKCNSTQVRPSGSLKLERWWWYLRGQPAWAQGGSLSRLGEGRGIDEPISGRPAPSWCHQHCTAWLGRKQQRTQTQAGW